MSDEVLRPAWDRYRQGLSTDAHLTPHRHATSLFPSAFHYAIMTSGRNVRKWGLSAARLTAAMASCSDRQLLDAKCGKRSFAGEMLHRQLSATMFGLLDGKKWVVSCRPHEPCKKPACKSLPSPLRWLGSSQRRSGRPRQRRLPSAQVGLHVPHDTLPKRSGVGVYTV